MDVVPPLILFEVATPLGFRVRVDRSRWGLIVDEKHPAMKGRESEVRFALEYPDEVRQSKIDEAVFLFYRAFGAKRWVCAVAGRRTEIAYLITAYPTDAIKEGVRVWPK